VRIGEVPVIGQSFTIEDRHVEIEDDHVVLSLQLDRVNSVGERLDFEAGRFEKDGEQFANVAVVVDDECLSFHATTSGRSSSAMVSISDPISYGFCKKRARSSAN